MQQLSGLSILVAYIVKIFDEVFKTDVIQADCINGSHVEVTKTLASIKKNRHAFLDSLSPFYIMPICIIGDSPLVFWCTGHGGVLVVASTPFILIIQV